MSDVTHILSAIEQGDPTAADELLPLIYKELRELAAAKLAREKPGHTLQPTALVHEAYMRLAKGGDGISWNSRSHFFAAAAESMRRILIESARRRSAVRRGGHLDRQPLSDCEDLAELDDRRLLDLDEALQALQEELPDIARLVELRFFGGLTIDQAADALGVSSRTANRHWVYAKAWLNDRMH